MGFLSLSPCRGEEWKRGQIRIHRTHVKYRESPHATPYTQSQKSSLV